MTAIVLALLILALLVGAVAAFARVAPDVRVRLLACAVTVLIGAILLQPLALAIQAA